jgi:hypothetical protein
MSHIIGSFTEGRNLEAGRTESEAAPTDFIGHESTLINSIAMVLLVTAGARG